MLQIALQCVYPEGCQCRKRFSTGLVVDVADVVAAAVDVVVVGGGVQDIACWVTVELVG